MWPPPIIPLPSPLPPVRERPASTPAPLPLLSSLLGCRLAPVSTAYSLMRLSVEKGRKENVGGTDPRVARQPREPSRDRGKAISFYKCHSTHGFRFHYEFMKKISNFVRLCRSLAKEIMTNYFGFGNYSTKIFYTGFVFIHEFSRIDLYINTTMTLYILIDTLV